MIRETKTYKFTCDKMRYTDESQRLVELCGSIGFYDGVDEHAACQQAEDNGWHIDDHWTNDRIYVTCPYATHPMWDGSDWPTTVVVK